jgi:hypothetical protein
VLDSPESEGGMRRRSVIGWRKAALMTARREAWQKSRRTWIRDQGSGFRV